ncbi:MAG: hypothetical protein ABI939_07235, partial [Anaerolineaceae bacterium]
AGKLNAISGAAWVPNLRADPQDYLVIPAQPWLDGFAIDQGVVRQFVAERLGEGYSVEEQLTGKADFGGLQLLAYPMRGHRYEDLVLKVFNAARRRELQRDLHDVHDRTNHTHHSVEKASTALREADSYLARVNDALSKTELLRAVEERARLETLAHEIREQQVQVETLSLRLVEDLDIRKRRELRDELEGPSFFRRLGSPPAARPAMNVWSSMGMAAGGRMRQEVYADPYGIDSWDQSVSSRCFVTLLSAAVWNATTGEKAPTTPPSAKNYADAKLPWFEYYDPYKGKLVGSKALALAKSWASIKRARGKLVASETVALANPIQLGPAKRQDNVVREPKAWK